MKNLSWSQIKGFIWFIFIYTLVRYALSLPVMSQQNTDSLAIAIAALTLAWLTLSVYQDDRRALVLSTQVVITTIFVYLFWGDFGFLKIQYTLAFVGIISLALMVTLLVPEVKKMMIGREEHGVWWLLATIILLPAYFFLVEEFLPTLTAMLTNIG